jgi:Ca2+-binding EF-hand superfamily protein
MSHTVSRHPAGERELKEEFAVADRDRDHRLNYAEFTSLLQGLEAGMSAQELRIGFHEIDTDADGLVDFKEFVDWWTAD